MSASPLHRLLRDAADRCGAAEATYWSLSADARTLRALANASPAPERLEGLEVPVEGSLVGLVLCTGQPTALGPDAAYHPAADEATGVETRAMAAAPVRRRGQAVGVISAINPTARALFGAEDLARLQEAARRLGTWLEGEDQDG